jgi:hypothetical protein
MDYTSTKTEVKPSTGSPQAISGMPVETLRLQLLARGDDLYLSRVQNLLREQEADGDIYIVYMDDEVAHIQYLNPTWARVLSSADGGGA